MCYSFIKQNVLQIKISCIFSQFRGPQFILNPDCPRNSRLCINYSSKSTTLKQNKTPTTTNVGPYFGGGTTCGGVGIMVWTLDTNLLHLALDSLKDKIIHYTINTILNKYATQTKY